MSLSSKSRPLRSEALWPFVVILIATLLCWAVYWYGVTLVYPNSDGAQDSHAIRGQFGDMFGGLNALFSAMAFAVLIYTMWLQRIELRLQREELQETRAELSRSARAQEKSEEALTLQVEAMRQHVVAATAQASAMYALSEATKDQARHERELATASRHQAEAMQKLASVLSDIKYKIK